MAKIKYDFELMKIMSLFESLTGAKLKDAIDYGTNDTLIFIVDGNEVGLAIGKNGANVKRVERMLKKRVKIVEYSNNLLQFIKNLVLPLQLKNIEEKDGSVFLYCRDTATKAMLIGRNKKNINLMKDIVNRYFEVKEIRVV